MGARPRWNWPAEWDQGGKVCWVKAEAWEKHLGRNTMASSLLLSLPPVPVPPIGQAHQSQLAREPGKWVPCNAEQSTGRAGDGPESKQANDWQGASCLPIGYSPEMQNLPAPLVIQTVYIQKESRSILPAVFDVMPKFPSHTHSEVLNVNKNQAHLANPYAFKTAHPPVL